MYPEAFTKPSSYIRNGKIVMVACIGVVFIDWNEVAKSTAYNQVGPLGDT